MRLFAGLILLTLSACTEGTPDQGQTLYVQPDFDHDLVPTIADWFEDCYSIRFRNYPVGEEYLHEAERCF